MTVKFTIWIDDYEHKVETCMPAGDCDDLYNIDLLIDRAVPMFRSSLFSALLIKYKKDLKKQITEAIK